MPAIDCVATVSKKATQMFEKSNFLWSHLFEPHSNVERMRGDFSTICALQQRDSSKKCPVTQKERDIRTKIIRIITFHKFGYCYLDTRSF